MNQYFLHIGLHKTGTKFFQHKVFPNLDSNHFIYNPPKLTQLIADLLKADEEDLDHVLAELHAEKARIAQESEKKVIISREIMSGDLFSFYKDFDRTSSRLNSAFDGAVIICSLRYQLDWIMSCYRETVHEHHYQGIEEFLSLKKQSGNFVKNSYKDLDLVKIINLLIEKFGKENVNFLFYEDFKKNKEKVVDRISKIIGTEDIPIRKDSDKIPNRGYSAFSIKLSILRYRVLKLLGLSKIFVHRPIYFFGPRGIPAGFEHLSVLPREKYWRGDFLRDNEEVRSKNYPSLSLMEKIKLELSWRSIIKKRLDKMFYWDWDLLGDHREELNNYFQAQNVGLLKHIERSRIPDKYLS